jgi:predicted DCC family thiol-disulfide oxidoreductase YuxK
VNTPETGPARHGAGGTGAFTVLYDAHCPLCRTASRWLQTRDQLVPLRFVAAGSAAARQRFPGLNHEATLRDITVVADTGEVYVGDGAWVACLWSLAGYRELAERLSRPHLLPLARQVVAAASAVRQHTRDAAAPGDVAPAGTGGGYGGTDDRTDCTDERCG